MTSPVTHPCALFVDLRRKTDGDAWPKHYFSLAYIVTGNPRQTEWFFTHNGGHLKTIPYISCEITDPSVVPFLQHKTAVSRLSLPEKWVTPGLLQAFDVDVVLQWDHRRKPNYYHNLLHYHIDQGAQHISLYGLQDFDIWLEVQNLLVKRGLYFYERFHAAVPGQESPYQNHLAQFHDVIALQGWSRLTENGISRVKSPQQLDFMVLDEQTKREEAMLLGLSNRRGMPLVLFNQQQIAKATLSGLAAINQNQLCPTDEGLWDTVKLMGCLV